MQANHIAHNKRLFSVRHRLGLEDGKINGEPLLIKVMENGRLTCNLPTLEESRNNCLLNLSKLSDRFKRLRNASKYPVRLSLKLRQIKKDLSAQIMKAEKSTPH